MELRKLSKIGLKDEINMIGDFSIQEIRNYVSEVKKQVTSFNKNKEEKERRK